MIIKIPPITKLQASYIDGLLIDCGYITTKQRQGFLSLRTVRGVKFIDELNKNEASMIIEILIDEKG